MRALATTAAAAAALAILAGCSGGPPRHGDVIDRPADSVTPLTCWQQYQAWKHGPAETPLKAFDREIRAVRAAGSTDNISRLRAALVSAGKAAGRLTELWRATRT